MLSLSADAKSVVLILSSDPVWIGGTSGDLGVASNWSNGAVPGPTTNAIITAGAAATLTNSASFKATSITFPAGCPKVTIEGAPLEDMVAINNLSSANHEFKTAVIADALTISNTTTYCVFTGGLAANSVSFGVADNTKAAIYGDWHIKGDWHPVKGNRLYDGATVTVDGTLVDPDNLSISAGCTVTAAALYTSGSHNHIGYINEGRLVVTGQLKIEASEDCYLVREGQGGKATVKLIIGFGGRNIKRMTDEAEAFTAVAKGSPALEYYFIADEPHIEKAGDLRDCIARYEALDPAHPCYVNLLGAGWDPETRDDRRRTLRNTGCDTYGEYLERLYDAAPLKMISFDVYPVCAAKPLGNAEHRLHGARAILNDRWYETLETASAFARKRGLPMFAFALSTAHGHFPGNEYVAPSIRHFRLQMYSNLAYGAQALQYFRYWAGGIAPVLVDGKRSPVFELVREMNQELQARAFVFMGAKVRKVWHTGVTIPIGTKRLDPKALPPFVTSFTADKRATLAVSWLKNGNTDYLVVLNRDPNDDTDFAATFAPSVKLVRRDGSLAEAGSYANFFWLEPGDVAVFAAP